MVRIHNSKQKIDTLTNIQGEIQGVLILTNKDLKDIDFILCGLDVTVCVVPRKLTPKEESHIRNSMFQCGFGPNGNGRIIILEND